MNLVELKKMKMNMETYKIELDELTEYTKSMFGEELFKNTKEFISILPAAKKKSCVLMLSKLSKCNKEFQDITKKYYSAVEKFKLQREPTIQIFNEVFPGTIINIKKRIKKIERKYDNVKFFEDNEEKLIKFTYIV